MLSEALERHADRVARCAGLVERHQPLLPKPGVDKRRFAHVGTPRHRELDGARPLVLIGRLLLREWKALERQVQQGAYALAMRGRHRQHIAQAELKELGQPGTVLHAFGLVGDQQAHLAQAAQVPGYIVILSRDAIAHVHHEQDHVGLRDGLAGLFAHLLDNPAAGIGLEAAGVNGNEREFAVFALSVVPVPRQPGKVGHDRVPGPGQTVEQGRLAHVGAANQSQNRFHALAAMAAPPLIRV